MAINNIVNLGKYTFSAYLSSPLTNVTGDATHCVIICDTAPVNEGSAYNTTTGLYTAPVSGNYLFSGTCLVRNIGSGHSTEQLLFQRNNSAAATDNWDLQYVNPYACQSSGDLGLSGAVIVNLTAGDYIAFVVIVTGSTKTIEVDNGSFTNFSGCLLL